MDYKLCDPVGCTEMCDCLRKNFQQGLDTAMAENLKRLSDQLLQKESNVPPNSQEP